jgi:ribonuclease HI
MLRVYTDGSCINNGRAGNRGGYAAVYPDFLDQSFGCPLADGVSQTNQTAELTAIHEGLLKLKTLTKTDEKIIRICTDSEYAINCLTKWVAGWRKKDWKTAEGKPVVHREIIEKILDVLNAFAGHQFCHIKAHTGLTDEDSTYNDMADRLAKKSVTERRMVTHDELEFKVIRSGDVHDGVLPGIPLAIMGGPIEETKLFEHILQNIGSLDKKYLKTALMTALKKTLQDKAYDIEKTKIHTHVAYRLVEKTHLTIERSID